MNIREAVQIGTEILENVLNLGYPELYGWRVTTNNRKRAFGVCNYRTKQIELSNILIPHMTNEGIKDTIIHEIAHALTRGHNHDHVWRRKCIELGGNGNRVGNDDKFNSNPDVIRQQISKYTLICPTCGLKIFKNRKPKKNISCGKHGNYYNPQHKFEIIINY
jgi:predicted SprT family Zn-dependent metalloprotease